MDDALLSGPKPELLPCPFCGAPKPELLPCPFCGASPHWMLPKIKHCQLHGDPYQYRIIACPKGHAQVRMLSNDAASETWNTRKGTIK